MSNCIFKIGSATQVHKVKRILAEQKILVKIIKIAHDTSGCTHGIEFNCKDKLTITHILLRYNINFEEYAL